MYYNVYTNENTAILNECIFERNYSMSRRLCAILIYHNYNINSTSIKFLSDLIEYMHVNDKLK